MTTDPTQPHICTADGGPACPGHTPNCEPGCAQPAAAADSTGRPPRASAGASLVSGEYDEAAAHHDALVRQVEDLRQQLVAARQETARVRSQLAEARQQRDQAAEALVQAETERDAAREIIDDLRAVLALSPGQSLTKAVTQLRDDLAWLRRQVLALAEDLERYASDPRPETLPMSERKLAWTLRQIVAGERPEAPETAPSATQTDEQTQVRADTHTGAETGSQGPLDTAAVRAAWLRVCGSCDAGYPTACTCPTADPRAIIAALVAEIDRLRDQWRTLATLVEPLGILDADSTDPATLTDRICRWISDLREDSAYQARVLGERQQEIDRLRTEAAMLRAEREWLADRARTMGIADAIIAAHGPAHAVSAEAGRLRAKVKHLSARVREWEAVHADLAARCDSGDIPIRLGERYSQAVLQEIDRLRAERDALRAEVERAREIAHSYRHEIGAAQVLDVLEAALGSTPDTGSTP